MQIQGGEWFSWLVRGLEGERPEDEDQESGKDSSLGGGLYPPRAQTLAGAARQKWLGGDPGGPRCAVSAFSKPIQEHSPSWSDMCRGLPVKTEVKFKACVHVQRPTN